MWLRVGLRPLSSRPDPSLSGLGRGHRLHRSVVAASPPPLSRAIATSAQQVDSARRTPAAAQPSRAGHRRRRAGPYIGFMFRCSRDPKLASSLLATLNPRRRTPVRTQPVSARQTLYVVKTLPLRLPDMMFDQAWSERSAVRPFRDRRSAWRQTSGWRANPAKSFKPTTRFYR